MAAISVEDRPTSPTPRNDPQERLHGVARTEEGTGRSDGPKTTWANIQVGLFGVGGLIHVAVGLLGGMGGFLTKPSGFARNA